MAKHKFSKILLITVFINHKSKEIKEHTTQNRKMNSTEEGTLQHISLFTISHLVYTLNSITIGSSIRAN
jgi:hypothetical protein